MPLSWIAPDKRNVTGAGRGTLRTRGTDLIAAVHAIPAIDTSPCSLVTLHRQQGGAPLPAAQVDLLLGANPDLKIATCDRRLSSRR